jgi:imidazoleglycerol-phosphate dehydratase
MRKNNRKRVTTETEIVISLDLDEASAPVIETGRVMFDHLLTQFAFHSGCGLRVKARSRDGIEHHLVEDVALVLGDALDEALGERARIERFGTAFVPMDDALVRAVVDLGGRPYARVNVSFAVETIEGFACVLFPHFFSSFALRARIGLHVDLLAGSDPHHCAEAAFKAFARACRAAWTTNQNAAAIPSTKGVL